MVHMLHSFFIWGYTGAQNHLGCFGGLTLSPADRWGAAPGGALHLHTLSALGDAPQTPLLVALLRGFGIAFGFYCSKMCFSCLT